MRKPVLFFIAVLLAIAAIVIAVVSNGSGTPQPHGPIVAEVTKAPNIGRGSGNIHRNKKAAEEKAAKEKAEKEAKEKQEREAEESESPPTEAISCTKFLSTSGNDANTGTEGSPWRTVKHALVTLTAGQTACLAAGQTFNEETNETGSATELTKNVTHGASGSPIVISSISTVNPATVKGRIVTEEGDNWITFQWLKLSWNGITRSSITVDSAHTTYRYDNITAPKTICINPVVGSFGNAEFTTIEFSRIHGCGSEDKTECDLDSAPCTTPPNGGYFIHDIYDSGIKTTIKNNYIYEASGRGIQMRTNEGATVEHNVVDKNQSDILFAEGATKDKVAHNIATNSFSACGTKSSCNDYGIWSFWTTEKPAGVENTETEDDSFNNQLANFATTSLTFSVRKEVDPKYKNAATHNYKLEASSPLTGLGYGPESSPEAF